MTGRDKYIRWATATRGRKRPAGYTTNRGDATLKFIEELQKRSVFRAAVAYLAIAWLLVQVAETVLEPFGIGDEVLRMVIIVAIIGFVPTVVFAWYFEFTATGLRREADVDHRAASAVRTDTILNRVAIVTLGLAVTYFAVDKFLLDDLAGIETAPSAVQQAIERYGDRSLVVMPFANVGDLATESGLGESLATQLQGLLAEIREWRIISRTTATAIREQKLSMSQIARELQVRYVVEGSARRVDDRLTVDVALIDARSDIAVWSERFDRPLAELFDVQDEVVHRIVDELHITILGDVPASRRVDPEAYVRFMQARRLLDETNDQYDRVASLLDQALAIDPDYADAIATRSWLYWRYQIAHDPEQFAVYRDLTAEEAVRRSYADIARALELDPQNAIAAAYRGWELAMDKGDLAAGARWFERALALGPQHADVIRTSSYFANRLRRNDDAVRIGEYGLVRDPLCVRCQYNLKDAYMAAGQFVQAERLMEGLASPASGGYVSLGLAQLLQGNYEQALVNFDRQRDLTSNSDVGSIVSARGMALYSLGRDSEADAALRELEALAVDDVEFEWDIMRLQAWRGDAPAALRSFDKLVEQFGEGPITRGLIGDVIASRLENQPRVRHMLGEEGLSRDELNKVRFEFTLPSA